MTSKVWGLLAFIIAAMFFIVLGITVRRTSSPKSNSSARLLRLLQWASWQNYIPIFGGVVCFFIGMFELTWKPFVIGAVAIAIGVLRVWSRARVRRALQGRR